MKTSATVFLSLLFLFGAAASAHAQVKEPPQEVTNSIGMQFVFIKRGEFRMGSDTGYDEEKPPHQVRISKPFYLGKYEVTQGQWQAVMGKNPSCHPKESHFPVECVTWKDVEEFIKELNKREPGVTYRLPKEAEWEYAARAGTTTAYSFGENLSQLGEYAWFDGNSGNKTHPVGQRKPNRWGLHDMHGNVWEWVQDWYGPYSVTTVVDPTGPASGSHRVQRGGSWGSFARGCQSATRRDSAPDHHRHVDVGLRLLREVP